MCCVLFFASVTLAQDDEEVTVWKILPYEMFKTEQRAVDGKAARALIDRLVEFSEPRSGLTNDSGGGISWTLTNDAFGDLVRMGPAALPVLLESLSDKRPTKLAVPDHGDGIGGVFQNIELRVPLGREQERKRIRAALGTVGRTRWFDDLDPDEPGYELALDTEKPLKGHTVTVGDCSLAIVGQIVNRPYEPMRYQPSVITAVCSPTVEPRIAKAVRAAWSHEDPTRMLAKSFMDDFHTRGHGTGELQASAAARLCLYFPKQAGALVAARIRALKFDIAADGFEAQYFLRDVLQTGHPAVRAEWMKLLDPKQLPHIQGAALAAISETPDAEVQTKLKELADATQSWGIFTTCLYWLPKQNDKMFQKLEGMLRVMEGEGRRGYSACGDLLDAMIRQDAKRSRAILEERMRAGHAGTLIVTHALWSTEHRDLAVALLPALLADQTEIDWRGHPQPGGFWTQSRRVCDYAAYVLALVDERLEFSAFPDFAERDRVIAAMQKTLAAR